VESRRSIRSPPTIFRCPAESETGGSELLVDRHNAATTSCILVSKPATSGGQAGSPPPTPVKFMSIAALREQSDTPDFPFASREGSRRNTPPVSTPDLLSPDAEINCI
jgi:hypothetical protein